MWCSLTASQRRVAEEEFLELSHAARETPRGTAVAFRVAKVTIRNLLLGFVIGSQVSCGERSDSDRRTTAISGIVTPPTAPGSAPAERDVPGPVSLG